MSSDKKFLGENQGPFNSSGECANRHQANRFTCPGCYGDLSPTLGVETRKQCVAVVRKTHEEPEETDSVARMIRVGEDTSDENE